MHKENNHLTIHSFSHNSYHIYNVWTRLQCPSRNQEVVFPLVPVHNAEEAVEEREDNQLPVEQFVDAALPTK